VALLLFGTGQAAKDHPALAERIRAHRTQGVANPTPRPEQISELVARLRTIDPQFTSMVTQPVQTRDPFVVEAGMQRLARDLETYLDQFRLPGKFDGYRPDGIVWHDANVVTELNIAAVINAAAWANAAAATEVAVVLVVVPSAVSYGFDMRQPNSLDRDGFVAAVARAL
jgi:SdpC family antimicrobial peptide